MTVIQKQGSPFLFDQLSGQRISVRNEDGTDTYFSPQRIADITGLPLLSSVIINSSFYLTGLSVIATSYGDHWEYSPLPARAWADILAIPTTSLATGMICRATDLGLHTFIWDGSNWQSLNNAPIKIGSSRTQVTGALTSNLIYSPVVPANILGAGGRIICEVQATYTSSVSAKNLYIANSVGAMLASARCAATGVLGVKARLVTMLNGSGSMLALLNSAGVLSDPFYSSTPAGVAFDQSVSQTLTITLAQGAAETFSAYGYDMWAERRV